MKKQNQEENRLGKYLQGAGLLTIGFAVGWTRDTGWIAPMWSTYAAVMLFIWYKKDKKMRDMETYTLEKNHDKISQQSIFKTNGKGGWS